MQSYKYLIVFVLWQFNILFKVTVLAVNKGSQDSHFYTELPKYYVNEASDLNLNF